MSLNLLTEKYKSIVKELEQSRLDNCLLIANDTIALVNRRLESQGVDANGVKFPSYSQKGLSYPKWSSTIINSSKPSALKPFAKKVNKGLVPSYENIRKELGRPTDRRTHVFDGDMLRSINSTIVAHGVNATVVEIKPKDATNQKKMNANSKRMGISLLQANKQELGFITEANRKRVEKIINKYK